jgi:PTS system ascorbate-specific IIB component
MKILTVCGHGLGSSFLVEMNIKNVLNELGVQDVEIGHSDLTSAATENADIFVVGRDLEQNVARLGNVILLNSLIDVGELKTKLEEALKGKGVL